ncbi:RHS repeat-associated core domain-containing protein [Candidatus Sororendozoicomonas aggregata]|uniref:RHS repeat-associated core domain-containing protein n=1 Tax=Candidatus Sororendozoicomonas aggregata TaxID=3073239 RepID=UPI002ED39BE5
MQQFHYSGPDIIAEYGTNWNTANAVYGHGAAVDDPLLRLAANDPRYYHGDGLGSITAVSNGKGEIVASNGYDHWGNITASTGTTPQFGYTGREPDATGLVYYRNRYYDPQIGRFTQLDPKGFIDGVNRYAYVMNSPVNYVDPWGLSASSPIFNFDSGGIGSGQNNTIDPYSIGQTNFLETCFPSTHQPIQAQLWSAAEADAYYNSPEFQKQGAVGDVYVVDLLVGGAAVKGTQKAVSLGSGLFGKKGTRFSESIDNFVIGKPRTGSANKVPDGQHGFNDIIDNYAGGAAKFEIPTKGPGGKVVRTSELGQIQGSNNGVDGVFEWIIDKGEVTHRRFIPRGKVTGFPNQVPKK